MQQMIKEALKRKNWAVIGVSDKKERFGYKIPKTLLEFNYDVVLVNPNLEIWNDRTVVKDLESTTDPVEVIDVVINKSLAKDWVQNTDLGNYDYIWFQPGSYDEEVIKLAKEKNPNIIFGACVLIELRA